ncbi:MAG: hypothetical protein CMJ40_06910 [Phycisphaerae bacterium]|nr:hypothetical protein [Phycisphaerae bacterium]|tara:strand:- start:805 stop:1443 length:639 start_codon:yes stop_codon:yes gene_type:complete
MTSKPFDPKPGLIIILVAALIGCSIWWWAENRHRFFPKRWGEVVPGSIYRSGQLHRDLMEETLRENGVDVIVCLRPHEPDHPDHVSERAVANRLGIEMVQLELVGDGTGSLDHYVTAVKKIKDVADRGDQVLVHCAAGAYRTGVAVTFYRLLVEGGDPSTIRDELKAYGWREKTDDKLIDYLDQNMAEMANRLKMEGVIEVVPDPIPMVPDS